ncbi:23S rRNA (adenine(1618)-N(6))-methyltransferase RlmF [Pedobacter frigiditerrae]|uniref:Ribosomal RNA large subunit methyltransferase F n=1 Tax=Pedobacter frigiditerrae TaxID=2530452 RepID=A0A4R0MWG5_9SPHI|nr:23S rRNA (adenine(1618)-N(6))-methyltransferase RlmF [Pedobacter frigiditerrae]TCC91591.1 23S rRNA (adenine(1618)-N(6))-methyltransferase RlmF [Pedobacter frigiditerrae]
MEKSGAEKSTLHSRNKHRSRYDFKALTNSCAELRSFVSVNKYGDESIDFANPVAVKILNKALLKHFYQIEIWDIPEGYLCPPIPGRADYMHYAADLLASCHHQVIPKGKKVKVLDVGVGANCVYPIIGHQEYGWDFVGSDIDDVATRSAKNIVDINPSLKNSIELRLQPSKREIFKHIIHKEEKFDLTICNPPFHASAEEALAGSQRKSRNLGQKNYSKPVLNFGGQHSELWTQGGEVGFISKMIEESKSFKSQCFWFTSLISKSENLPGVYAMLNRAEVTEIRTSEMSAGNKITRIVAWTYLNEEQQEDWVKNW